VLNIDTSVDDISASTLTGALIVGVSLATRSGAGKASDTPWSIVLLLGSLDGDDGILLNVLDLQIVSMMIPVDRDPCD
jgi:hypothetical protein